ncbi:hypothetical protein QFZ31_006709 [Neobacillus niacini]|uniref:DNA ligase LigA-related protein n=1 Tax=Neobacillus driksii TaxID=3035913 RepID=UPI002783568D|nr:hypothetical protein [Neobacillus niacini]MDQ0976657.1 hypothetical protein [Neobacillus niacini]
MIEWANRRQRQILVHSFLYYQLNESIISDHTFDQWSKELAKWIKENPDQFKMTVYYDGFKEFDGSSGYDLPYSIPDIQNTGYKLLKIHAEKRKL